MVPARRAIPIVTIAVVAAAPIAIVSIHAALESAVPPASAAEPSFHVGQDGEATFLAVVETLVERIRRISDALHRARGGGNGLGAVAQAHHRIIGSLRTLLVGLLGILCIIRP